MKSIIKAIFTLILRDYELFSNHVTDQRKEYFLSHSSLIEKDWNLLCITFVVAAIASYTWNGPLSEVYVHV